MACARICACVSILRLQPFCDACSVYIGELTIKSTLVSESVNNTVQKRMLNCCVNCRKPVSNHSRGQSAYTARTGHSLCKQDRTQVRRL